MALLLDQIEAAIQEARQFLDSGRVGVTDLICQSLVGKGVASADVIGLLGEVAGRIGEFATARRFLELSRAGAYAHADRAIANINRMEATKISAGRTAVASQRFHLIKAWGFGFTSDLDHTLGHLLLAEMAGRIPVIHWGGNSLFRDASVLNAWTEFFEPVSAFTIADLARAEKTFYPVKWSAAHLDREELNKWEGSDSKTAGITLLNQSADVTVGDFFTAPIELLPWFAARHPQYRPGPIRAEEIEQTYRYLIDKYLKPVPAITAAVDRFATEHFQNRKIQAVHVRGSDKVKETPDIDNLRQAILQAVQTDLAADPSLHIFLLTDDLHLLETYGRTFPGRIISTDCLRTGSSSGVHYSATANRTQLGFEVLRDTYLAARCERFIGVGTTNVSNFIMHLKAWPAGSLRMAGPVLHHQRSALIV